LVLLDWAADRGRGVEDVGDLIHCGQTASPQDIVQVVALPREVREETGGARMQGVAARLVHAVDRAPRGEAYRDRSARFHDRLRDDGTVGHVAGGAVPVLDAQAVEQPYDARLPARRERIPGAGVRAAR